MRALARDRVNPLYLEEAKAMQAAASEVEMSGSSPSARKAPKSGSVESLWRGEGCDEREVPIVWGSRPRLS
jgi:hypothetical protein